VLHFLPINVVSRIDLELFGNQLCLYQILLKISLMLQTLEFLFVLTSYLLILLLLGLKSALHLLLFQVLNIIFQGHIHLLGTDFVELPFVLFYTLQLLLCELGQVLLSGFQESIGYFYEVNPRDVRVIVDFWLEVEEDREQKLFRGIDELLVKAEALDL
jgi:hypothetical protein